MTRLIIYNKQSNIPQDHWNSIKKLLPEKEIEISSDQELLKPALDTAEIAVGRIPFDMVIRSSTIKWYQHMGAGVDFLMKYKEEDLSSFLITNASGAAAIQISEHCIALLLSLTRKIHNYSLNQDQKKWFKFEPEYQNELYKKRVLLLGYGAIGSRVATLLKAFGATIDVIRHDVNKETPLADHVGTMTYLQDFIKTADIIILTNQLTPETHHCLDFEEFHNMQPHTIVINIARGKLINEVALIKACQERRIAGAGLDVFEEEPLPYSSHLWVLDNVLITPHSAGLSKNSASRSFSIFVNNLKNYLTGNPMQNVINTSHYTST